MNEMRIYEITYLVISFLTSNAPCLCQPNPKQPSRLNIQRRHRIDIRFLMYSLYAWVVPMIIVHCYSRLPNLGSYALPDLGNL